MKEEKIAKEVAAAKRSSEQAAALLVRAQLTHLSPLVSSSSSGAVRDDERGKGEGEEEEKEEEDETDVSSWWWSVSWRCLRSTDLDAAGWYLLRLLSHQLQSWIISAPVLYDGPVSYAPAPRSTIAERHFVMLA